jgi:trehalose synthase-fused probable maltokinase
LGQGRLEVRARGLHVRQARDDQHGRLIDRGLSRATVEAAVAGLDLHALAAARWFAAKGQAIARVELDEAFVLDPVGSHVLAVVTLVLDDDARQRYQLAFDGAPLRLTAPGDGTWRALAVAMAEGRTVPSLRTAAAEASGGAVTAALVCRPGPAMPEGVADAEERDLGADQSHTSVVLGEAVLLKAYRRLQPGLNPDLEMTAFLSEDAGFAAVPPLAGFAELVETRGEPTTVAMASEFVAGGEDAFEAVAGAMLAWLRAPGQVSLEVATEIAADLGSLTAGLHAALTDAHGVPGFAPREATRAEIRSWAKTARAHLDEALAITPGPAGALVRDLAPRIAEALTVFDALPTTPEVIRAHGDYHLGQVLVAPDGFRIVDFEGVPTAGDAERRAPRPALRDVASMLRSLDHVARTAAHRFRERDPERSDRPGLDLDGWIARARERFLDAYRDGLREAHVWMDTDPALLRAFEIDQELYEFTYATRYMPSWLYAATEGMTALFAEPA